MRLEHFQGGTTTDNDDAYTIHYKNTQDTTTSTEADTGKTLLDLMTNRSFVAISLIHKFGKSIEFYFRKLDLFRFFLCVCELLVAVLYYVVNMFTAIKLEDPIFFNKDAWIALIKEVS